jgi:hypothetical protein
MTLGTILARLDDDAVVQEALASIEDIVLLARLRSAADAAHEPLGSFAAAMVGQFVQHGNDEQWLALMTAANRAQDPAASVLRRILLETLPGEAQARTTQDRPRDSAALTEGAAASERNRA